MSVTPVRGQVYWADLGFGPKPWLIVSNNLRNRKLRDVLGGPTPTTYKPASRPSWGRPEPRDPLVGHVNTDDLQQLGREELGELAGCLRPATLLRVNEALGIVLALP